MKIFFVLMLILCYAQATESVNVDYKNYFKNCHKELDNGYFKTCYNYNYKSAVASYIELSGDNVNSLNIKIRDQFIEDLNLPVQYRTNTSNYTKTGFDRGHIQSDASNDYSIDSKNVTYLMSNVTLQYPITNRRSYLEVEKRERELATEYKYIKALTLITYTDTKINGITIPKDFTKIYWNDKFSECYNIKNDNTQYTLEQMKIDCSDIANVTKTK